MSASVGSSRSSPTGAGSTSTSCFGSVSMRFSNARSISTAPAMAQRSDDSITWANRPLLSSSRSSSISSANLNIALPGPHGRERCAGCQSQLVDPSIRSRSSAPAGAGHRPAPLDGRPAAPVSRTGGRIPSARSPACAPGPCAPAYRRTRPSRRPRPGRR